MSATVGAAGLGVDRRTRSSSGGCPPTRWTKPALSAVWARQLPGLAAGEVRAGLRNSRDSPVLPLHRRARGSLGLTAI